MKSFPFMLVLIFFSSFVLLPSITAASCFLYPESSLYCHDLTAEEALQECTFFDSCSMSTHFISASCAQQAVCNRILCKSTCQEEYQGLCPAGEIPAGKEAVWCNAGCCLVGESCSSLQTQWYCEIEAQNQDAPQYYFGALSAEQCDLVCTSKVTHLLRAESTPLRSTHSTANITNVTTIASITTLENSDTFFWSGLLALGLLLIFAGLLVRVIIFRIKKPAPITPASFVELPHALAHAPEKSLLTHQQHEQKIKEHQREELFTEFGAMTIPEKTAFRDLQRLIKHQEHHHSRTKKVPTAKENLLQNIRKIAKK